jgi:hypothetical protein
MIITKFVSYRLRPYFRAVTYLLIFCFALISTGCETTERKTISVKEYHPAMDYKVIGATFKDGSYKTFGGNECKYFQEYQGKKNVLVFEEYTDTVRIDAKSYKLKKSVQVIELKDVQELIIEKYEANTAGTVLITLGIIIGVVLIAGLIVAASSCPFIYSYDGDKYVFDAEPLGGAVCEALSRTDNSRLPNLSPVDGKFKILVKNEADEVQYLDELKLCIVTHEAGITVTPNPEGEYFKYSRVFAPESVTDENGKNVTAFFSSKDKLCWQTEMNPDTLTNNYSDKHSLKFRFRKPEGANNALLFFNGGTALWGSEMIRVMMQLRGDKLDEWYSSVNSRGADLLKLYSFMDREELFTLRVNLLEGNEYNSKTYIPAGGPYGFDDKVIRVPLDKVQGEYTEIVLTPPPGYWKIDQLEIIYEYEKVGNENIKLIDAISSVDQDGKEFSSSITGKDDKYYIMPETGDYSVLYFSVPEGFDRNKNDVFLKTTGYYELNLDKSKPEQTNLIKEIMYTPGKIIEYTFDVYKQRIKSFMVSKNSNKQK